MYRQFIRVRLTSEVKKQVQIYLFFFYIAPGNGIKGYGETSAKEEKENNSLIDPFTGQHLFLSEIVVNYHFYPAQFQANRFPAKENE